MKNPTIEELQARIVELERRIAVLEAQPREQHYHYHHPIYQQPYGVPDTVTQPLQPITPYKVYIGDPPGWMDNSTVTWTDRGRNIC